MKVFDPKQVIVILDGQEISDWGDGSDVISVTNSGDAGEMVIGADGRGVFIANPDKSGKVVLKLKQHSADNALLSRLFNQQKEDIGSFSAMQLSIRDLINNDIIRGTKGFFTTPPAYTRGKGHNPTTWTIQFETITQTLDKGK